MGAVGALAPTVFLPRPEIIHICVPLFLPRLEVIFMCAPTLFSPVGRQCVLHFLPKIQRYFKCHSFNIVELGK